MYMFYDQWPFCLVAMATLNIYVLLYVCIFNENSSNPLKQYDSNFVQIVQMLLRNN